MAEVPAISDLLAVGVLAVGAFCAGRVVLGLWWRRPSERDVDLVHVAMGVSMAAMLSGHLAGGRLQAMCAIVFGGATVWFGRAVVRDVAAARPGAQGGHLPHLVASGTMLYMLLAIHWNSHGSMAAMSGGTSSGGLEVLAAVVGGLIVLDAAWAMRSRFGEVRLAGDGLCPPRDAPSTASATVPWDWPGSAISNRGPVPTVSTPAPVLTVDAPAPVLTVDAPAPVLTVDAPAAVPAVPTVDAGALSSEEVANGGGHLLRAWRNARSRPHALAPRCASTCLLVMSLATAYMVVTMRP